MDSRLKLVVGATFLSIFIIYLYMYFTFEIEQNVEPAVRSCSSNLPVFLDVKHSAEKDSKEKLIALAKAIHSAKKHVRGSKTSDFLKKAISIVNNMLGDINVNPREVYERRSVRSEHICGEVYMGGAYGYPQYYTGFVTDKCSYGVPVSQLVTVIKYIAKPTGKTSLQVTLDRFIFSIKSEMNNSRIRIAINISSETFSSELKRKYPGVKLIFSNFESEGSALNSLIKDVQTPYVLVTRKMNKLTNDSMLERLVREIESINVTAVGGALRESNGHWRKGCFQSVHRNYTLKYMEGYDESYHECLFCDYIQGPFITTAKYLKENSFKHIDENNGLYEDWFLRITQSGRESIVCPDSMFHVDNLTTVSGSNWKAFSEYWNVYHAFLPMGNEMKINCEEVKISSSPSKALSPCAMKVYSDGIKLIMRKCEETGTICELQEGTGLGAVKLGKNLPWDIDYDLRFSVTNCSKCKLFYEALKKAGLKVNDFAPKCCNQKYKLGEKALFSIFYKGKRGDFTGHPVMDSDMLVRNGLVPTKVLFDGQWLNVARNPGLFMRNRYGKEMYRHAEHWRYTGEKSQRPNYTTNVFITCKQPGAHDCLDRYNADGDFPFNVMLP
ncbi:uncharacterized protein LOC132760519 [Ruditapes philippinarum]|uniref:uncharacterized protein LOC132760519 n=1 Tax=Ruditapes philippinarum TaxID=129788 RepID=UPI00295C1707|nr:uncharacterized protein LOC132760519 [Ruditapes philippinarum]